MSGTVRGDGPLYTYEVSPAESVSEAVVAAVSAVSGRDRTPAGTDGDAALAPLYSVVDSEALDALFRESESAGALDRVEFPYEGYRVSVHGGGLVTVRPATGGGAVPAESGVEAAETADEAGD